MKPEKVCQGLTFFPVPEFDDASVAFGADANAYFDRRDRPDVPREWENYVDNLFFSGGHLPELSPKVDRELATRAIRAWLSSFAPPHESKITTAAYALWLWTSDDVLSEDE